MVLWFSMEVNLEQKDFHLHSWLCRILFSSIFRSPIYLFRVCKKETGRGRVVRDRERGKMEELNGIP